MNGAPAGVVKAAETSHTYDLFERKSTFPEAFTPPLWYEPVLAVPTDGRFAFVRPLLTQGVVVEL